MASAYSSLFGEPHVVLGEKWCGQDPLGKLDGLEGLPVEMILDIYKQLDIGSIFSLGQVNTLFHGLLKRNKAAILLPVLQQEFSPFAELLQVYTASDQDLSLYGATFQPRRVIFRRFPGDTAGLVLSRGGMPSSTVLAPEQVMFNAILSNGKPTSTLSLPAPQLVALTDGDLPSLLQCCRVVRQWEELYPQLHWFSIPEDCRQLTDSEKFKLRRALYRWWLYAFYFHGELPRPRGGQPEAFVNDIRNSHMRIHSTCELLEIRDIFEAGKALVRHYIFPNLEQNLEPERIVDTYAKLDPRDLMFYFENLFNYPRKRLVGDVNLKHPDFSRDQESLGAAVQSATDERPWLEITDLDGAGGIVDCGKEGEEPLCNDGNNDGIIPPPGAFRRPLSDWAPPGDDGRMLAERDNHKRPARYSRVEEQLP
ncbi:hypothetical protein CTRI78_v010307 [Colletotrichum trifolii]|uniref:F-box domain-containing protein n=1 Tax=Colletotrichum trifolii TaxID=5466 RepID=A0A4R8QU81_COLTR|nr:hypothetical protein CTRI78_v010307 [Colletotrichum trifolii]